MANIPIEDNGRTQFYLTDDPTPMPSGETVKLFGPTPILGDILKFAQQLEADGKKGLWLCDEFMCMELDNWSVKRKQYLLDTFNYLNEDMYLDLLGLCERTLPNWFSDSSN